MTTQTVPKLDLAPKLNRPLSLWNPLDYLRLLYWVFFFPQAIRWYVEKFGTTQYNRREGARALLVVLQRDEIQRNLVLQSLLLNMLVPVLAGLLAQFFGLPWSWFGVAVRVAVGVAFGETFEIGRAHV